MSKTDITDAPITYPKSVPTASRLAVELILRWSYSPEQAAYSSKIIFEDYTCAELREMYPGVLDD